VYGALELARLGGVWFMLLGVAIVLFEAGAVLVLRAHYTALRRVLVPPSITR
jgi:hypothetical protein